MVTTKPLKRHLSSLEILVDTHSKYVKGVIDIDSYNKHVFELTNPLTAKSKSNDSNNRGS